MKIETKSQASSVQVSQTQTQPSQAPIRPEGQLSRGDFDMPEWMAHLNRTSSASGCPLNVRLFVIKIVMNRWRLFAPYSCHWLPVCLKVGFSLLLSVSLVSMLLTQGIILLCESETGCFGFNYFFRDFCVLIGRWGAQCSLNRRDRGLASKFVNHLLRVCPASLSRGYVLRSNVDMVKLLVEQWNQHLVGKHNCGSHTQAEYLLGVG